MPHPFEMKKAAMFTIPLGVEARNESLSVEPLTYENEREVLAFLSAAASVQAVFMESLVRDNGLESPFNRGIFYGVRRAAGRELAGVALVGHATLVETNEDAALKAFAHVARARPGTHVIMCEEERIKRFWRHYARGGQRVRLVCREMLFELRDSLVEFRDEAEGLRLATLDDLPFLMPVQACMAFEESGINPMECDAVGFRLRCARRIEQGRVFVWIQDERLLFKADILADTERAVYLEGVYTSPAMRNQAHGSRCLSQMSRTLLSRTRSIQLLVNEQNRKAVAFYRRAGFNFAGYYDTIFLQSVL
ncbi:MAG TPA: GNAT family N-acetyltransferase [Pyrinomonadaceae bacterium]|jgi:ribosomal protein S18 acetylase RimI-like enzyme